MNNINRIKYAFWEAEYNLLYGLQRYNKGSSADQEIIRNAIRSFLSACERSQIETIGCDVEEAEAWIDEKILAGGEWIRQNYDPEFNFLAKLRGYAEVCKQKHADGVHNPESLIVQVERFREECRKKHEERQALEAATRAYVAQKAAAAEKLANEQAARLAARAAAAEA